MTPVGLTGGIATGKSTVSGFFRELGAVIVSGDEIARTVLAPGSPAVHELAEAFGQELILHDGSYNRKVMLEKLLEDPRRMKVQLRILKPLLLPVIDRCVADTTKANEERLIVVEAPLLFEYGKSDRYRPIVVVTASYEQQIRRLSSRSGRTVEWAEKVIQLQIPMEEKIRKADYVIDNSGSLEQTRKYVEKLYRILMKTPS